MNRMAQVNWQKSFEKGILSVIQQKAQTFGKRAALSHLENREWKNWTYDDLAAKAKQVSNYLIDEGIEEGDRVAILSESRPEWVVAFFAAVRCGAIVVPLDAKLTATELSTILADAQPGVLFVSAAFRETAERLLATVPSIGRAILLHGVTGDAPESRAAFPSINDIPSRTSHEVRDRTADETALIVYTSGTTGKPKGVMITLQNLLYQCNCFEQVMKVDSGDLFLSILPLNHLFELSIGLLGVLFSGGRVCFANTLYPQELAQIMREKKVTRMVTVPLFLAMLKASIEKQVRNSGPRRERAFRIALQIAARIESPRVRRLLFRSVHKQLGGKLRQFLCGGAPLDVEVGRFFEYLGIAVHEGYGLTETSPVVAVNAPADNRLGSVGRPLPGTRVRLLCEGKAEEGEIVVQGPGVMKGYYKDPHQTRAAIDERGWFHTGDLGKTDRDGFVYITGRVKNLIVLGSGKKVSPEDVESAFSGSNLFKEVCVIGRVSREGLAKGTESVCAVVVPSDVLIKRCNNDSEIIQEEVHKEIQALSQSLAFYKRPAKVLVRFEDFPKTSTLKIKRSHLVDWVHAAERAETFAANQLVRRGAIA
jgi:long-chain acyl-CoA synthetase